MPYGVILFNRYVCFLHFVTDYHQFSYLKRYPSISTQLCWSEVQHILWLHSLGYYKTEVKVSPGVSSCLEALGENLFSSFLLVGRI